MPAICASASATAALEHTTTVPTALVHATTMSPVAAMPAMPAMPGQAHAQLSTESIEGALAGKAIVPELIVLPAVWKFTAGDREISRPGPVLTYVDFRKSGKGDAQVATVLSTGKLSKKHHPRQKLKENAILDLEHILSFQQHFGVDRAVNRALQQDKNNIQYFGLPEIKRHTKYRAGQGL